RASSNGSATAGGPRNAVNPRVYGASPSGISQPAEIAPAAFSRVRMPAPGGAVRRADRPCAGQAKRATLATRGGGRARRSATSAPGRPPLGGYPRRRERGFGRARRVGSTRGRAGTLRRGGSGYDAFDSGGGRRAHDARGAGGVPPGRGLPSVDDRDQPRGAD